MKEIAPPLPPIVHNQFETVKELFQRYVVPSYGRFDLAFTHGSGSYLFDVRGKRFLDLGGGIAVCSLGHAHPEITQALIEHGIQAQNLMVVELNEELHQHLKRYGVRVKREEVMEFMPEETIEIELWDVGSRPKSGVVADALEMLERTRDEDLIRHEEAVPGAVETMRNRQEAELLKLPALAREIVAAVEDGLYVPVFLNFVNSIDALVSLLAGDGITAGVFDGRDTKNRDQTLQDFMDAKLQCIILQSQAGSAAIDLHDIVGGRPRCTFICPTYHAETMLQMLGRATRFGAKSPVLQRICFAEGTIEERVYRVAETKCENIRAMNDGMWANAFGN
jgi:SNF2 family DNA or RNA helicase